MLWNRSANVGLGLELYVKAKSCAALNALPFTHFIVMVDPYVFAEVVYAEVSTSGPKDGGLLQWAIVIAENTKLLLCLSLVSHQGTEIKTYYYIK